MKEPYRIFTAIVEDDESRRHVIIGKVASLARGRFKPLFASTQSMFVRTIVEKGEGEGVVRVDEDGDVRERHCAYFSVCEPELAEKIWPVFSGIVSPEAWFALMTLEEVGHTPMSVIDSRLRIRRADMKSGVAIMHVDGLSVSPEGELKLYTTPDMSREYFGYGLRELTRDTSIRGNQQLKTFAFVPTSGDPFPVLISRTTSSRLPTLG